MAPIAPPVRAAPPSAAPLDEDTASRVPTDAVGRAACLNPTPPPTAGGAANAWTDSPTD